MDTVSQIKQKLDIVDVVGSYISLKKSGKNYKGLCPFHSEDTPSFMVSPELQIFKCFGCGEGGDMFNFVEKIEGIEFAQALEQLADRAGVEIEKTQFDPQSKLKAKIFEANAKSVDLYHFLLTKHKAGKLALEYIKKERKLTDTTIKEFKIGYAPDSWDTISRFLVKKGYEPDLLVSAGLSVPKKSEKGLIDKFRGRVMFPFIDVTGKTVGFTGRDIVGRDPKYLNTQETNVFNKSIFLFGLDKAKVAIKKKGALFVEGQMDVIKAFQNGVDNAVATSGTSITVAQLKIIQRYTSQLIFCFDPDEAGISATVRALELADKLNFEVKVAVVPEGYSDLDDLFNKKPEKAKSILNDPVPIYDFYLASALKRFDSKTAYGKKRIVEYLAPFYSKISNGVVFDHYIKLLSEELDIREESLRSSIKENKELDHQKHSNDNKNEELPKSSVSPEEYVLSLLLKGSIDTIGHFVYKLESEDFENSLSLHIFDKLRKYSETCEGEFDIKHFTNSLEQEYKDFALKLYLQDLGGLELGEAAFAKEIEATLSRLKKETVKRKLKKLSEQIKLAELEKDTQELQKLLEQFDTLKQDLK